MAQIGIPDDTTPSNELADAVVVTYGNEVTKFPNSRRLVADTNVTFDPSTPNVLRIGATGSGGGSTPSDAASITYSNLASGLAATTVQTAIDEVAAGGGGGGSAALIHPTRVLRNGIGGVVSGTLDEANATTNRVAMQAVITDAISNKAWLEVDEATFNIGGGPLTVPGSAGFFHWIGSEATAIVQRSNNVAIIQLSDIGGGGQIIGLHFEGASLFYGNDQSANSGANMLVLGNMWQSTIKNVRCSNTTSSNRPYRGVYMPAGSSFFTNRLANIFSFQAAYSLMHVANFGTGNSYDNIYLSGVGPAGTAQNVSFPLLLELSGGQQIHDSVVTQMNIEWCICNSMARINNVRGIVFDSFHLEQCKLSGADAAIVRNVISNVQINGGAVLDVRITAADTSGSPSVVRTFNSGRTLWNNFVWVNNNSTYVSMPYYMHYQPDTDGFQTSPGKVQFKQFQIVDGVGTVLRDNMRVDRTVGGTDAYGGDWSSTMHLNGASELRCGSGVTVVQEGELRIDVTKTIYGMHWVGSTIVVPGNLTGGDMTLTFSNKMGPPGSRYENIPVPHGSQCSVIRGGNSVNTSTFANYNGVAITSVAGGTVPNSRLQFYFDGTNIILGGSW